MRASAVTLPARMRSCCLVRAMPHDTPCRRHQDNGQVHELQGVSLTRNDPSPQDVQQFACRYVLPLKVYDWFLVVHRIDSDQDALVIMETMLAAIAFDVKLTIGIALHLPHRLIRHAVAMSVIKLHQTTSAQTVYAGVLSSVDIRFWRAGRAAGFSYFVGVA